MFFKEENPYERILANEMKETFTKSKMILVLHRNSLSGEDFYGVSMVQKMIKTQNLNE